MDIVDPCIPLHLLPDGCEALVIAEHQDEYRDLPAVLTPLEPVVIGPGEVGYTRKVITRWSPTPEERARIAAGEDLYLTIWGTPIRPVLLTTGVIDWRTL